MKQQFEFAYYMEKLIYMNLRSYSLDFIMRRRNATMNTVNGKHEELLALVKKYCLRIYNHTVSILNDNLSIDFRELESILVPVYEHESYA